MARIIFHIGDKVTHTTLGGGVVTVADEEYVTIKFATDELTFRLPDAFEKGFLSSEYAIIEDSQEEGDEEEEEEILEGEDETEEQQLVEAIKPDEKKEGKGCAKAVFLMMGVVVFTPFVAYYVTDYGKTGNQTDLLAVVLFIIGFLLYVPFAMRLAKVSGTQDRGNTEPGLDAETEIMAGMIGSELIHRSIEREKQAAEKRRYDSLYWQESIRDKNPRHDFDYDHVDN